MSGESGPLRAQLERFLDWEEAHVGFDKAVDGIPEARRGARAQGFEHTPWQIVEHLRIAQKDLLDFCLNPKYRHVLDWPRDYWPIEDAPPSDAPWRASLKDFVMDRGRLKQLVGDEGVDLFAVVPTGQAQQTYLRAILLVADHNAYHLGQLVAIRKALGLW